MPERSSPKPDPNQTAADLVRAVTGSEAVRGEDLFGDPAHREEFLRLKREDAERQARERRGSKN